MKYFLARIVGARVDVMQKVPSTIPRQSAMGAVLLTTAAFAAISAAYALSITGVASGIICVIIGLAWGLAILNLDRMLVLGLNGEKSIKKTFMLAVPRVALAVIIGFVISTPLMLKIFDTEISAQLNKNILASQEQLRSDINNSSASTDLATAEARQAELRAMINAGPTADPAANPKVKEINASIAKLEDTAAEQKAEADGLRAQAIAEEEGTGGTGVAGCAAMCAEKKRLAAEAERRWQGTLNEILGKGGEIQTVAADLEGSLLEESQKAIADAEAELPGVEQKVVLLSEQIRSAQDGSYALEQANTGIIARLKALGDLTAGNATANGAYIMVTLLFMAIEVMPVLFKVLSNLGSRTPYDEVADAFEAEEIKDASADIDQRKLITKLRLDAEVDTESARIADQQQIMLRINKAVIEHQSEVVEAALAEWTQHAKQTSAQNLGAWVSGLNGTAAPGSHPGAGPQSGPGNGAGVGAGVGAGGPNGPFHPAGTQFTTLSGPGAHLPDPQSI